MSYILKEPKIDLHCHLDGSIPPEVIRELAGRSGIQLPEDERELRQMLTAPDDCNSLKEYLSCFSIPIDCLKNKENLKTAVYQVLKNAANENNIYMEIRFAPLQSVVPGFSVAQVLEAAIEGMKTAEKDFGISASIIACVMRHESVEKNIKMLQVTREFLGHGVGALDLAGSEAEFPMKVQAELFREARRIDMPFTIHAGECGNVENVVEAVELGARRIGHGIALMKDIRARELVARKGACLEMCPISNFQTKAVSSPEQYPIGLFLQEGLKVTINTDNRTVSDTSAGKEWELLEESFGIRGDVRKQLLLNAVEYAFTQDDVKQKLFDIVEKYGF